MTSPAGDGGQQAGGNQATGAQGGTTGQGAVQPSGQQAGGQGGAQPKGQQQGQAGQQASNGLYDKYLAKFPAGLHGSLTEVFREWDADVTRRQQEVRSQYAPYESLVQSGADPQRLQAASELLDWLQEDPAAGMRLIAQELGVDLSELVDGGQGGQPGAGAPGGAGDEGLTAGQGDPQGGDAPPWFQQFQEQTFGPIQQMVHTMAQALVEQHQGQQTEQEIDQLEQLLESKGVQLQEGDPKLGYVLGQLAMLEAEGQPITEEAVTQAVQSWEQLRTTITGQQAGAQMPPVLPGGGGLPTQQVDPASLSQSDRRKLAAQRAAQMMAAGRG